MNKYEAMLVLKNDLGEEEKNALINQIKEVVIKNKGQIQLWQVWQQNRRLAYPLKRYRQADYYLMHFSAPAESISSIRENYRINENILRFLILCLEKMR